ncbi:MAG: histidinol-phosphate transaminase [Methylobacillus sp.]|jgi:histidinol-phosphate aminotransferase|nr:histidinol-phosphate transaminase [Methylobacillus sp.]
MSKFWSASVKRLTPYVPGEQPKLANLVKLNTNENPYAPSPRALAALQAEIGAGLRLYPDPNSEHLRAVIADHFGFSADHVFVGNGSDEVLALVFQALLKHEKPVLFPDITYSFYPVYCGLYEVPHKTVPLTDAFEINVDDYAQPNGGIIFPNPNAPTGRLLALGEIERLLQANADSVVVLDEAYIDFGGDSAVPLVKKYPQLLVVQTFSKSRSLAGLRVGYALGHPDLIVALTRVKDSFNSYPLDRLAQAGAAAAMQDRDYFETTRRRVIATREKLVADLAALGFHTLPSGANFIFTRHATRDGAELTTALRDRSIIIRHFKTPARIAPYLRISIGTDEQSEILIAALREILG